MRKTISLFLFVPEKKAIVLSQRAAGQHHPYVLQATCHGAIEAGEDHADALERELREETGLPIVETGPLTFLGELAAGNNQPETWSYSLAPVTEAVAASLKPNAEVARFVVLYANDAATIVARSDADETEVDPAQQHVMFTDELKALQMAFAILNEHNWNPTGMLA